MDSKMKRFHLQHGKNISIDESRTVATRSSSFADAIVFSSNPLLPNEQFVVQILQTERGWSGHLRIGLTQIDPSTISSLPQFAMPNLVQRGRTWICALSKLHSSLTNMVSFTESTLPTEVGGYLGVRFVPCNDHTAEMKISVNGRDLRYCTAETLYDGPLSGEIPYQDGPIYAVFDVYGTTKAIGVVQISYFPSLQDLCRQAILRSIQSTAVSALPLPKTLKMYLLNDGGN
ncbi:neuralized-like protein 2 isoform X2 [Artemia franciscana]|uniref:neuralized-like protein 2 isoform X2 n=1 Tax=Artemia franciscana TaxID=6661 RepID=UPI0032DB46E4